MKNSEKWTKGVVAPGPATRSKRKRAAGAGQVFWSLQDHLAGQAGKPETPRYTEYNSTHDTPTRKQDELHKTCNVPVIHSRPVKCLCKGIVASPDVLNIQVEALHEWPPISNVQDAWGRLEKGILFHKVGNQSNVFNIKLWHPSRHDCSFSNLDFFQKWATLTSTTRSEADAEVEPGEAGASGAITVTFAAAGGPLESGEGRSRPPSSEMALRLF